MWMRDVDWRWDVDAKLKNQWQKTEDKIKVFMLKRGEIKSRIDQCGVSA